MKPRFIAFTLILVLIMVVPSVIAQSPSTPGSVDGRAPGQVPDGPGEEALPVVSDSLDVSEGPSGGDSDEKEGAGADPGGPGLLDIVHLDDVIASFSLCVGLDCVNGESFGFDTVRLKENNLRLHFDDTSTSASFPRNDWRITINDSANGGDSYFGIEDATAGRSVFRIEAGAPSHALFVESTGDVGLGTNNPVVRAHLSDGDTPTVRLEQNGTSGWSPQTWDVAGNETNFFIRDVSNGSKLPFRIQPGADSNSLTIRSDGKVGIGTWSPGYPVHLQTNSSTDATIAAQRTSGATAELRAAAHYVALGSSSAHPISITVGGNTVAEIEAPGYLTMYGDKPLTGHMDNDNLLDIIMFRPSSGQWHVLNSTTNWTTGPVILHGRRGDVAVSVDDHDGDGLGDLVLWRPSTGRWYVDKSTTGFTSTWEKTFTPDTPLPAAMPPFKGEDGAPPAPPESRPDEALEDRIGQLEAENEAFAQRLADLEEMVRLLQAPARPNTR